MNDLLLYNYADVIPGKTVILMASHHGSSTGTNSELIDLFYKYGALDVQIVISAGIHNQHSHPSAPELLPFNGKAGTPPEQGDVLTTVEGNDYQVFSTQHLDNEKGSIVFKSCQDSHALYTKRKGEHIDTSGCHQPGLPAPYRNLEQIRARSIQDAVFMNPSVDTKDEILKTWFFLSKKGRRMPVFSGKTLTVIEHQLKLLGTSLISLERSIWDFYEALGNLALTWGDIPAEERQLKVNKEADERIRQLDNKHEDGYRNHCLPLSKPL